MMIQGREVMMRKFGPWFFFLVLLLGVTGCSEEESPVAPDPFASERQAAYDRGLAYAQIAWTCSPENLTASCSSGYFSAFIEGPQVGMPYAWGQGDLIHDFLAKIANGYGAGCTPEDGLLDCTTGIDAPSLAGRAWGSDARNLQVLLDQSVEIDTCQAKLADALYDSTGHVVIKGPQAPSGQVTILHAAPGAMRVVQETVEASYLESFTAIRYESWVDDTGG